MAKSMGKILGVILVAASSWLVVCLIVQAITICFGWDFVWNYGTGVWLSMILIRMTITGTGGKK